MTVSGPQLSINQFAQQAVPGMLDLQISKSGVIAGLVSANASAPLIAGQAVLIDSAQSVPGLPAFKEAGQTDAAFGMIVYTVKAASFAVGDPIEVAFLGGPVMFCVADNSIQAGQGVDSASTVPNVEAHGTTGSAKQRGIALDPASAGQFTRVLLTNPTA